MLNPQSTVCLDVTAAQVAPLTCIVSLGLTTVAIGKNVAATSHAQAGTLAQNTTNARGTDTARPMRIALKSWLAKISMEAWEWSAGIAKYPQHALGPQIAPISVATVCL